MKKLISAATVLLLLGCCMSLLGGCMRSIQLNERAIVQAIGIDLAESGGYRMTMQAKEVLEAAAAPNQSGESGKTVIIEREGGNMTDMIAGASVTQGRQLFLGSMKVVVIGEKLAQKGVGGVMNFLNSSQQIAPSVLVVVARGEAGELIKAVEKNPALSAGGLLDIINSTQSIGYAPDSRLQDILGAIHGENICGTLAVIGLKNEKTSSSDKSEEEGEKPEEPTSGETSDEESGGKPGEKPPEKPQIEVMGSGLFCGDRLERMLGLRETRGLQWMQSGKIKAATLSVETEALGMVSSVTHSVKCRVTPDFSADIPVFRIDVTAKLSAVEVDLKHEGRMTDSEREHVQHLQEQFIRSEIESALSVTQMAGYDVYGLSLLTDQRKSKFYRENINRWPQVMMSSGYSVEVEAEIDRSGSDNRVV